MSLQPNPNLAKCANVRGLGPQLLMAIDTKSKPGKFLCHFVRFETIEFANDTNFDNVTFKMLDAENDPRIPLIVDSVNHGGKVEEQ
jgi:hypothetical protein